MAMTMLHRVRLLLLPLVAYVDDRRHSLYIESNHNRCPTRLTMMMMMNRMPIQYRNQIEILSSLNVHVVLEYDLAMRNRQDNRLNH